MHVDGMPAQDYVGHTVRDAARAHKLVTRSGIYKTMAHPPYRNPTPLTLSTYEYYNMVYPYAPPHPLTNKTPETRRPRFVHLSPVLASRHPWQVDDLIASQQAVCLSCVVR